MKILAAAFVIVLLTKCAGSTEGLPIATSPVRETCCRNEGDREITIEYLGSGGVLIRRADEAILTAPFFSNAGWFRVGFLSLPSQRERVQRHMLRVEGREHVRVVLAGHAHYDHLLDLAPVFETLPSDARLYGSDTTVAILNRTLKNRATSVSGNAGTREKAGRWTTVGSIRFMPIDTEHASHVGRFKLYKGEVSLPLDTLPRTAWGWREGKPLAFLIDFLREDGGVDFRIYYNDAAHSSPFGWPDAATLAGRQVDVAILTVASFHNVRDYPEWLVRALTPKHVVLSHWEDFFLSSEAEERTVRMTNVPAFLTRLYKVMQPHDVTMLRRHGRIELVPPR